MALRAKKPVIKEERFKSVVYANRGVGKTHFCCSFPNTYFIDTEGLEAHPHFVEMLIKNSSDIARINELSDIIAEVKTLLSTKHEYKTLVIDSISFPFHLLANMEAERLAKKSKDGSEGTEFGANMAKAKRQTFELGMLLSRLDMNVLVTAHEKVKYEKGVEIGKSADANEKIEYALGSVINLRRQGKKVRAFIDKSRYTQLPTGESLEFDEGYEMLKGLLGNTVFEKVSQNEALATQEQIEEARALIANLNVPEEWLNKRIASCRAAYLEQLTEKDMQDLINLMLDRIKKKGQTHENQ
jgi:hypothetical protein